MGAELDDRDLAPYRAALEALGDAPPVRTVFAAAHVVMRDGYTAVPHSLERPGAPEEIARWIDWDATMALRRRLDGLGFGVAEAMDTAQRFQLGWQSAARLIEACGALELEHGFVAGAGLDHLAEAPDRQALVDGVAHQVRLVQDRGGLPIVLPIVQLARWELDEEGYVAVYGEILRRVAGPVLLHWLGPAFLPELAGYFPGESFERIVALDPETVRGVKLSLLDREREVAIRRALLPRGQVVLTGDDLHFAGLIAGGDASAASDRAQVAPVEGHTSLAGRELALGDFSHALLGILDAIAEPAALALRFLAHGDAARYHALMEPCEELSRHLFQPPTRHYKAGLAFLAWLNGLQANPLLVNHEERARDAAHYRRAAELASRAGAIREAPLAARRLDELERWIPAST